MAVPEDIKKISDTVWEIPTTYKEGMRVPARIYATEKLLREMDEGVFDQVTNMATLPGILRYACCMPDGHWGYGFPIPKLDTYHGMRYNPVQEQVGNLSRLWRNSAALG